MDADAGDEANLVEFLNAKRKLRLGIGNCRPGFFSSPRQRHAIRTRLPIFEEPEAKITAQVTLNGSWPSALYHTKRCNL